MKHLANSCLNHVNMFSQIKRKVFGIVFCLSFVGASVSFGEDTLPTQADIESAWKKWTASISSFECECKLTDEITRFERRKRDDPFDNPHRGLPNGTLIAHKTATMKRQGADMIWSVRGEQVDSDNYDTINQSTDAAYRGDTVRYMISSSRSPLTRGEFGKRDTAIAGYAISANIFPILLWYDPRFGLEKHGVDIKNAKFVNLPFDASAKNLELMVELEKGRADAKIVLQNKAPFFLPLEFTILIKGSPLKSFIMEYETQSDGSDRLLSWKYKIYGEGEIITTEMRGKVEKYYQNRRIDDSEFILNYPVGTHLHEHTSGRPRFWIQSTKDKMKGISPKEYGRRPTTLPSAETRPRDNKILFVGS